MLKVEIFKRWHPLWSERPSTNSSRRHDLFLPRTLSTTEGQQTFPGFKVAEPAYRVYRWRVPRQTNMPRYFEIWNSGHRECLHSKSIDKLLILYWTSIFGCIYSFRKSWTRPTGRIFVLLQHNKDDEIRPMWVNGRTLCCVAQKGVHFISSWKWDFEGEETPLWRLSQSDSPWQRPSLEREIAPFWPPPSM